MCVNCGKVQRENRENGNSRRSCTFLEVRPLSFGFSVAPVEAPVMTFPHIQAAIQRPFIGAMTNEADPLCSHECFWMHLLHILYVVNKKKSSSLLHLMCKANAFGIHFHEGNCRSFKQRTFYSLYV